MCRVRGPFFFFVESAVDRGTWGCSFKWSGLPEARGGVPELREGFPEAQASPSFPETGKGKGYFEACSMTATKGKQPRVSSDTGRHGGLKMTRKAWQVGVRVKIKSLGFRFGLDGPFGAQILIGFVDQRRLHRKNNLYVSREISSLRCPTANWMQRTP
jgi:hypothetical protein